MVTRAFVHRDRTGTTAPAAGTDHGRGETIDPRITLCKIVYDIGDVTAALSVARRESRA